MKYLRKKDDDSYRLASMQARIFEKSGENKIASYFFIQEFMNSKYVEKLDDLSFLTSSSSELELYTNVIKDLKKDKGIIYPNEILHWIGFLYRYASYLTGTSSKELFKNIKPQYLNEVYPAYHALDIQKAIELVFKDNNFTRLTPKERFLNLYRNKMISL